MEADISHAAADNTEDAAQQTQPTRPPRKVSRWLLVAAAFVTNFLTDGLTLSFGVLLVEFLEQFQHERATTAIVGSLAAGVFHLVGPLAGLLSDLLGGRAVVIAGTLISFAGLVGATFSNTLVSLAISYGFFGGLGFGLMYLPTNAAVIQHFNKRRALATGIASCGSGVGTFVNSLLIRYLIDTYTWRWAILITAGMVLHGIPCGLLLETFSSDQSEDSNNTNHTGNISNEPCDTVVNEAKECDSGLGGKGNCSVNDAQEVKNCQYMEVECVSNKTQVHKHSDIDESSLDNTTRVLDRCSDIKKGSEFEHDKGNKCNRFPIDTTNNDKLTHKDGFNIKKAKLVLYTNLRLLLDFKCICFLLSTFVVNLAFIIPYMMLPDQVVDGGMTKFQASWLVSSIGISNTVSRVIFGWLADKKFVNRMLLFESLLVLIGINTAMSPLLASFEAKMVYSCVHGFLLGGYVMLIPVVLADLFGSRVIEESFGLAMFAIGIAVIISLPIGGWLFDRTGSYDVTFVIAGSEFAGGGFILLCPMVVKRVRGHSKSVDITRQTHT